jgi:hypothetical protein
MTDIDRYRMASKHVRKLKSFWFHLAAFLLVNAGLMTLNLVKQPDKLWFQWVLLGWGAGVLLHALLAFGGRIGKSWEERKINQIMRQEE